MFHIVDPLTLQAEQVEVPPTPYRQLAAAAPAVVATIQKQKITAREVTKEVNSLWLCSSTPSRYQFALIAAEIDRFETAPDLQAVAHTSQGVAIIRPLIKMPRAQVEAALLAAERTLVMNKAKQVGTGLIMYSADYDDNLPAKGSDINSLLEPYLKDGSLTQDFVYTFSGGNMSAIDKPAETVLGHVPGPGGRAVVYADGHVVWVKD